MYNLIAENLEKFKLFKLGNVDTNIYNAELIDSSNTKSISSIDLDLITSSNIESTNSSNIEFNEFNNFEIKEFYRKSQFYYGIVNLLNNDFIK